MRKIILYLLLIAILLPYNLKAKDISGRELIEKLLIDITDLKSIFISGYTENDIVHHGVLDRGISFLQKPFSPKTLVVKVKETLESK